MKQKIIRKKIIIILSFLIIILISFIGFYKFNNTKSITSDNINNNNKIKPITKTIKNKSNNNKQNNSTDNTLIKNIKRQQLEKIKNKYPEPPKKINEEKLRKKYEDFFDSTISKFNDIEPETIETVKQKYIVEYYDISDIGKAPANIDVCNNKAVFTCDTKNSRIIYLYNFETKNYSKIYECKIENFTVLDPKITKDYIYWTITPSNLMEISDEFYIQSYNLKTKKINTIYEGGEDKNSTLMPRIDTENNLLMWLQGTEDNSDKLLHNICYYSPNKNKITNVIELNYVQNPYIVNKIKNGIISYCDYYNNQWNIELYNTKTDLFTIYKMSLNHPSYEIPQKVISDGEKIVYCTNFGVFYVMNLKNNTLKCIDKSGYNLCINGDDIFYRSSFELKYYNIKDNKIYKVTDNNDKNSYTECIESFDVNDNEIVALVDIKNGNTNHDEILRLKSK